MNDGTGARDEIAQLAFSADEYAGRMDRVRAEMDRRGLDALLVTVPQNYYYLTGFELGASHSLIFLILPRKGEGAWVTRKTEQSNVRAFAPLISAKRGFGVDDSSDYVDVLADALRQMGLDAARIGIEESSLCFTIAQYKRLQQVCPRATLSDITGLVEALRRVKSPAELNYMRAAGAISAKAISACFDALKDGVTDSELAAVLTAEAIRAGSGRMGMQPFVAAGPRTFRAHASWNGQRIGSGEVINVELASQVRHYHVPTFRVFVIGKPTDEIRRMHDASEEGMRAGLAKIGPGMTSHDADRVVREAIEKTGYGENFVVRAAYGIGVALAPGWGETPDVMAIRPDDARVLAPGMCFHLVPALYKEGVGCVCASMPIEITADGVGRLSPSEAKLYVR